MERDDWWPDWSARPTVLVASGPSAGGVPLSLARGRCFVAAVNRSWELVPWADALYAADFAWWKSVEGCPGFKGLKITRDRRAARDWDLRLLRREGLAGRGENSGQMLLDAAVSFFGADPVILVGYDLSVERGLHWHGPHGEEEPGKPLANPNARKCAAWRRRLERAAKALKGRTVIDCGKGAPIAGFRRMDFPAALDHCLERAA